MTRSRITAANRSQQLPARSYLTFGEIKAVWPKTRAGREREYLREEGWYEYMNKDRGFCSDED